MVSSHIVPPSLRQVLDAGVKVASNQVQYSVLDRRPEIFMQEVCRKKDVAILPYGVLVSAGRRGVTLQGSPNPRVAAMKGRDTPGQSKPEGCRDIGYSDGLLKERNSYHQSENLSDLII